MRSSDISAWLPADMEANLGLIHAQSQGLSAWCVERPT